MNLTRELLQRSISGKSKLYKAEISFRRKAYHHLDQDFQFYINNFHSWGYSLRNAFRLGQNPVGVDPWISVYEVLVDLLRYFQNQAEDRNSSKITVRMFYGYGGMQELIELLLLSVPVSCGGYGKELFPGNNLTIDFRNYPNYAYVEFWGIIIMLLKTLCQDHDVALVAPVALDDRLIVCALNLLRVFSTFCCKNHFENTCALLYETLGIRTVTFDLSLVDVDFLIKNMGRHEFSLFAPILSLVLLTADEMDSQKVLNSFDLLTMRGLVGSRHSIVRNNHQILTESPLILRRCVYMLRWYCRSEYHEEGVNFLSRWLRDKNYHSLVSLLQQQQQAPHVTDAVLARTLWHFLQTKPESLELTRSESQWNTDGKDINQVRRDPNWRPSFDDILEFCDHSLNRRDTTEDTTFEYLNEFQVELMHEVIFVMSILAGGKNQGMTNTKLCGLGLIAELRYLFRKIAWRQPVSGGNTPIDKLKIQFLRLVHNFCDRYQKQGCKRHLLSTADIELLEQLDAQWTDNIPSRSAKLSEEGLVYNIISLMQNDNNVDSDCLYWMSSTIEAFLRGSTPSEQWLIASWGFVGYLVKQLTREAAKETVSLQIHFDLLGELVKYNANNMAIFEKTLLDQNIFSKLTDIARCNLIDSNVFIRTLIMSFERFRRTDPDYFAKSLFPSFLNENKLYVLRGLLTGVTLGSISQDSICCLNTALLIFMVENDKNQLAQCLKSVKSTSDSHNDFHQVSSSKWQANVEVPSLVNFRQLLWFWNHYYSNKCQFDMDSLALSSSIPFSKWRNIVDILCRDDGTPTSLIQPSDNVVFPTILDV